MVIVFFAYVRHYSALFRRLYNITKRDGPQWGMAEVRDDLQQAAHIRSRLALQRQLAAERVAAIGDPDAHRD